MIRYWVGVLLVRLGMDIAAVGDWLVQEGRDTGEDPSFYVVELDSLSPVQECEWTHGHRWEDCPINKFMQDAAEESNCEDCRAEGRNAEETDEYHDYYVQNDEEFFSRMQQYDERRGEC